jgi:hypothetical protein
MNRRFPSRTAGERGTFGRVLAVLLIVASALLLVTHFSGGSIELRGTEIVFAAGIVICMGLLPAILYYISNFSKPVPLFEMNNLFYVLGFGLPALSEVGFHLRPDDQALVDALWIVIIGLTAFWSGYLLLSSSVTGGVPVLHLPMPRVLTQVELAGWIGVAMGTLYSLAEQFGFENPVAKELCGLLGTLGRLILLWMLLSGQLRRIIGVSLLAVVIAYNAVKGITGGLLTEFLRPMLEILLVYVRVKRRVPLIPLLMLAGIFIFLNPVKQLYREQFWEQSSGASTSTKLSTYFDIAYEYWSTVGTKQSFSEASSSTIAKRFDHVGLLAHIMTMTPSLIPYWEGKTLIPLLYYWIPRAVWPDKPSMTLGNDWAKIYGIIETFDYKTSWNLPWIVEFYMNFGWIGVVICMFAVGALFAQFDRLFARGNSNALTFCVGIAIMLDLWYAESNFVLMWANVATKVMVAVLFCKYVAGARPNNNQTRI